MNLTVFIRISNSYVNQDGEKIDLTLSEREGQSVKGRGGPAVWFATESAVSNVVNAH